MTTDTVPTAPDIPPETVTRVYSFGYGHRCKFTGKSLVDHHATVIAPSAAVCREVMMATFGREWAFEYVSLDAATRDGRFPSTEHARLELSPADADPDHGRTTAVAEAKPDTLGIAMGRAAVPDMQTRPQCSPGCAGLPLDVHDAECPYAFPPVGA